MVAPETKSIFITGSSDGLGRLAAQRLVAMGHRVVLHARNPQRAQDAQAAVPGAAGVCVGDLAHLDGIKRVAEAANAWGRFDAVIHNAGVYRAPGDEILMVNTIAPYVLTCLMHTPQRLIYLSSGLHQHATPNIANLLAGRISYAESKFYVVLFAKAIARLWPHVYANAVDPGWVPTKMGGPHAPDSLEEGAATQVWLAVSEDHRAKQSGKYFYHLRETPAHPETDNLTLQEDFLQACEHLTGIPFPRTPEMEETV